MVTTSAPVGKETGEEVRTAFTIPTELISAR